MSESRNGGGDGIILTLTDEQRHDYQDNEKAGDSSQISKMTEPQPS